MVPPKIQNWSEVTKFESLGGSRGTTILSRTAELRDLRTFEFLGRRKIKRCRRASREGRERSPTSSGRRDLRVYLLKEELDRSCRGRVNSFSEL